MILFFWISAGLAVYPFLIYPLLVFILGRIRPRPVVREGVEQSVTILIPAHNEEGCIAATVENKLSQDYPHDKLQVIVVSDGSTDRTDAIVRGFAGRGVALLRREGREGKAAALNDAIRHATGEVVIFSDANSIFALDAVRRLVENFSDPRVGYVTGSLRFSGVESGIGGGTDAYMRYENLVRTLETRVGSVIGVNGGVDAIRRSLYVDIRKDLITDFVLPLHVISRGFRVLYDDRAQSTEAPNDAAALEFRMRVRVALRALHGLSYMRALLNPLRFPMPAFCILSHKVLRYLTFALLPGAFLSNAALAYHSHFYRGLFILQLLAYLSAVLGLTISLPAPIRKATVVPSYFLLSNAAFAVAVFKFLRGENMATWRPRAG